MTGIFDMHCHILPRVDDGSKSIEESLWMLKKEYDDGVRHIILTPHFRYEMFETPREKLEERFGELKALAEKELPSDLSLHLGCEIHTSMDMDECLKAGRRLTMAGSRYVLAEFSGNDIKLYIRERVEKLLMSGYKPILAHVERYRVIRDDPAFLAELRNQGAYVQVNADTISGRDGLGARWFAKKLMKDDLIDFVGTDGHNSKDRSPEMGKCVRQMVKVMGEEYARRVLIDNPADIIRG